MKRKYLKPLIGATAFLATVTMLPFASAVNHGKVYAADMDVYTNSEVEPYSDNYSKELYITSEGYPYIYGYDKGNLVVRTDKNEIYNVTKRYCVETNKHLASGVGDDRDRVTVLNNGLIAVDGSVRYTSRLYGDSVSKKLITSKIIKYPEGGKEPADGNAMIYNQNLDVFIAKVDFSGTERNCLFDGQGNYINTNASYSDAGHNTYFYKQNRLIGCDDSGNVYIYDKSGERNLGVNITGYNIDSLIYGNKTVLYKKVDDNYEFYILDVDTGEIKQMAKKACIGSTFQYSSIQMIGNNISVYIQNKGRYIFDSEGVKDDVNLGTGVDLESTSEQKKYYLLEYGKKSTYVDMYGNLCGKKYTKATPFVNGQAMVLDNNGNAYLINENFEQISGAITSVEDVGYMSEGRYRIEKDGLYYPVSEQQETIIPDGYNEVNGNGVWYKDGEVDTSYNEVYNSPEKGYIKFTNGYQDNSYTGAGFYQDLHIWYLFKDGKQIGYYTGILYDTMDDKWQLLQDGKLWFDYNGIYYDENYGWWKIRYGEVDFEYNDLCYDRKYGWWKITNGAVDFEYNDLYYSPTRGWKKISGGTIDSNYNDLYYSPQYGWWKVSGGSVDFGYNDLYYSPTLGWWKVAGGAVDFGYNDLYYSSTLGWWKVAGGAVDFGYNDLYCSPTLGWWKVSGGAVDFGYNDIYYSPTCGWWKVSGGAVDFGYTDLYYSPTYGWWKINGGSVDFDYNGMYNSPTYGSWKIAGGSVVFN